ncbi:MAG: low molecular weight phosphotyrosine protein phosphatase [Actinomycetia bacterium]|nr:low molecular weight phosphotyrosine protein phosphatase [Actinomycetes bacterium]
MLAGGARQFRLDDFDRFDLVLALDSDNLADLRRIGVGDVSARVHLLREFDPAGPDPVDGLDVPDPYYGGVDGFAHVFDVVDAACRGLLAHLMTTLPESR